MAPRGLVLVLLLAFLAGCIGADDQGFAGPAAIPEDAPSHVGSGDARIQVQVIDAADAQSPVARAAVAIYRIPRPESAPTVQQLLNQSAQLGGRTDDQGALSAGLDVGATYTFIAQAPGLTVEARHLVRITEQQRNQPLRIGLFPENATAEVKGKIAFYLHADPGVRTDQGAMPTRFAPRWWPADPRFDEDDAVQRQLVFRLQRLDATLTYTVPPGGFAGFGIRAAVFAEGEQNPSIAWDRGWAGLTLPPGATSTQTLSLGPGELAKVAGIKNPSLRIGPSSSQSALSTECLDWNMKIDAWFGTEPRAEAAARPLPSLAEFPTLLSPKQC